MDLQMYESAMLQVHACLCKVPFAQQDLASWHLLVASQID